MREYHVTKDQPDHKSQLESMAGQMVAKAVKEARAFKASVIPGKGTLTFTLSMDIPEHRAEAAQQLAEDLAAAEAAKKAEAEKSGQ